MWDRRVWYGIAAVAVIFVLLLIAWASGWFEPAAPPEAPAPEVQPEAPPQ